jgi:farnesyl diphosphate synthase
MTDVAADFAKRLDQTAEDTEAVLAKLLSDTLLSDEIARPTRRCWPVRRWNASTAIR